MLATRIIPCLDIDRGRVVKGTRFKNIKDAGDPVKLAKRYNQQKADELIFLDIGASYRSREILINMVKKVSDQIFIPLTVGGGIRSISDIKKVLNAGADKVSMCTSAIKNPVLISRAAESFGSQCIVVSIDAKKEKNNWKAYINGGRENSGLNVFEWVKKIEKLGAGEILLNSIDKDGTKQGYDIKLTKIVSENVNIPVIASGGGGELKHIFQAIDEGKADAVLLASVLHYGKYNIKDIKKYLRKKGVVVR